MVQKLDAIKIYEIAESGNTVTESRVTLWHEIARTKVTSPFTTPLCPSKTFSPGKKMRFLIQY